MITGSGTGAHLDGLENVAEPHLHAFIDAKTSQARERRVVLRLGEQTWVEGVLTEPVVRRAAGRDEGTVILRLRLTEVTAGLWSRFTTTYPAS